MLISDLHNKLVAVLGYGQEGKAVTAYLLKHGIKPVLFDIKPWGEWSKEDQDEIKALNLNFIFGPDFSKELTGFDVAFRSPGIKISDIVDSTGKKISITSQTKLFFDNCPSKIIGVTGTKGKGTTCALIYNILKASGYKTYLTGNIGYTQPLEILDSLKADDYIVYELSSFQLQDLNISPHISVVLMVTSDHLDYHKDQKEYIEAKSSIAKYQNPDDYIIINSDYENSVEVGKLGLGKKLYFSKNNQNLDAYISSKSIIFKSKQALNTYELKLRGEHNLENICAAALVAKILQVPGQIIQNNINNFNGLEHRLEFAGEKNGISFFNDSFSTTPETAMAAIKSFTAQEILILGGSSKKSDFKYLAATINNAENIKAIILIGQEAEKIKKLITNPNISIFEGAKSMPEIFLQIKSIAKSGDAVILSPACASYDMFKNYKDRGQQFKEEVQKWR